MVQNQIANHIVKNNQCQSLQIKVLFQLDVPRAINKIVMVMSHLITFACDVGKVKLKAINQTCICFTEKHKKWIWIIK